MKERYKIEILTTVANLIGFGCHFLLNLQYINLLTFAICSLFTSLLFGIVGFYSKNRALLLGQIGWGGIAIAGIVKNI